VIKTLYPEDKGGTLPKLKKRAKPNFPNAAGRYFIVVKHAVQMVLVSTRDPLFGYIIFGLRMQVLGYTARIQSTCFQKKRCFYKRRSPQDKSHLK